MRPLALVLSALLVAPVLAGAEESWRHGRIRVVEGGVTLQRASEPGAEEAIRNLPLLPGDRVWTDPSGRAEFQFADGSVVRLDGRSKFDYVAHEAERVVVRLWSGSLYVHTLARDPDLGIETPGGIVEAGPGAAVRLDVDGREMRLSVYQGSVTLDGDQAVRLEAGEQVVARLGEEPGAPRAFDRQASDDFGRWVEQQQGLDVRYAREDDEVPEEIAPYESELDRYGSWTVEVGVGRVWRPYVSAGWRPYADGRWVWTAYGWTWVPVEPWGWAVSHYGRWDFADGRGWYWIPGSTWGPAWVSWSVGGDYVGWCPMGRRDRPVYAGGHGGHAVPRSSWTYARRSDLGRADLHRRRLEGNPEIERQVRVVESPRTRLGRDLTLNDGPAPGAVPRHVSTRPTPGDTVPELRSDPTTTIPLPTARRRPRTDEERDGEARAQPRNYRYGTAAGPAEGTAAAADREEGQKPALRTAPRSRPVEASGEPAARRDDARERERERQDLEGRVPRNSNRDVMRQLFEPLRRAQPESASSGSSRTRDDEGTGSQPRSRRGESRERGASSGERVAPRSEPRERPAPRSEPRERATPRSEPQKSEPRQTKSSDSGSHRPPHKDKDQ